MSKLKIITFEEHASDKDITDASRKVIAENFPNIKYMFDPNMQAVPPVGTLDDLGKGRIADMDTAGIAMQFISYSNYPQYILSEEAIRLSQEANDKLGKAVSTYPDRFGGFATLPLFDPQAAAKELERSVNRLGMKGALISGRPSPEAIFLDDKRFWPVLEMAATLKVPLYIHPGFPTSSLQKEYYGGFSPLVETAFSIFGWGWHAEAGIQVIRMILSGVFEEYPSLQVISGHWGEMVPFFLERLDMAMPKRLTGLPKNISEYYKEHVYVTPSGMFSYPQLRFIIDTLGADRILYSVDYPYISADNAVEFLESLLAVTNE